MRHDVQPPHALHSTSGSVTVGEEGVATRLGSDVPQSDSANASRRSSRPGTLQTSVAAGAGGLGGGGVGGVLGGGGLGGHLHDAARHMVRVSPGSPHGSGSSHSTRPGQHGSVLGWYRLLPYSLHGGLGGIGGSSGGSGLGGGGVGGGGLGGLGGGGVGGGGLGGHLHDAARHMVRMTPSAPHGSGSSHSTRPGQHGSVLGWYRLLP